MATTDFQGLSTADALNNQLDQYRQELNNAIKNEVTKFIHENDQFSVAFENGSASKDVIMRSLMDFAAEPSNVEEFADMIGDIAMNLTDLNTLNSTIVTILQAQQFRNFVKNLLGIFKENFNKFNDDNDKFSSNELIEEISQTVADYVTELTVDFVWDRVMSEEKDDDDNDS